MSVNEFILVYIVSGQTGLHNETCKKQTSKKNKNKKPKTCNIANMVLTM